MSTVSRARAIGAAAFVVAASLRASAVAADRIDQGDVKALDDSLGYEHAAIKAYADALAARVCTVPVAGVLGRFGAEHAAARDALATALTRAGQTPPPAASAPLAPESFGTEAAVLGYAYTLERAVAAFYLGSVATYKDRDYATLAASILGAATARVALLGEALRNGPAYPGGVVTP